MRKCWSSVFVVFHFIFFVDDEGSFLGLAALLVSLLFPYHSSPLVPCANYWWSLFCCCRSDLVWKMLRGIPFWSGCLRNNSSILYCIRDYYRFLLELYLILGEFLLLISMYFFELLLVISTMFCCGIVVFVWLIDCYIVRCTFWAVYSLLLWVFHVLSAVLQSSLIIVMLILGNFIFFSYWNVEMYVVNTKSSTDLKMVYVVDLSLFQ
jgi:hypothetical protein